ncbi:MAG: glycosyltransferase [Gemmatimonadaceae bacterium]
MARSSILSDELLRKLISVGQVDILVGIPTFNNASTIEAVVKAVHVGLARHFPRERTVLINPDGGSDDGTPESVIRAPMADEEMSGSSMLRTTHRLTVRHSGVPGGAAGVRTVFAAADLLQARAVVVIDADVTTMTPEWVVDLARPIWKNEADVVLPIYPRGRFDGPLVSQLVRPLMGAAYARQLTCNIGGDFSCSGRFAAGMVGRSIWDDDLTRPALDVWLVATSLAEDIRLTQAHLGSRRFAAHGTLAELFGTVVGAALASLDQYSSVWNSRSGLVDVPVRGVATEATGADSAIDPAPLSERYRTGLADLTPLLREILCTSTLARLKASAASEEKIPTISDPLWVTTVYEFAAAAHRGVMNREHLTQALVPLYLGRTASFFTEIAAADARGYGGRLAALEQEYRSLRPHLVELWNADGRR